MLQVIDGAFIVVDELAGWKWRSWKEQHDSKVLQGNLHARLQKDNRRGFSRADD